MADPDRGKFKEIIWSNLHVGMIVKIMQDSFFPADLVLLNSSSPQGIAYIETKNLDGETNLKHKQGAKDLVEYITGKNFDTEGKTPKSSMKFSNGMTEVEQEAMQQQDSDLIDKMKGAWVDCEQPNDMLYKFEGAMGLNEENKDVLISLGTDQMLLRGSSLRNTDYIYGLVVFTGHETKIMKNSVGSRAKFSRLELATNNYILLIMLLQLSISLTGAIGNAVWQSVDYTSLDSYLDFNYGQKGGKNAVATFFI